MSPMSQSRTSSTGSPAGERFGLALPRWSPERGSAGIAGRRARAEQVLTRMVEPMYSFAQPADNWHERRWCWLVDRRPVPWLPRVRASCPCDVGAKPAIRVVPAVWGGTAATRNAAPGREGMRTPGETATRYEPPSCCARSVDAPANPSAPLILDQLIGTRHQHSSAELRKLPLGHAALLGVSAARGFQKGESTRTGQDQLRIRACSVPGNIGTSRSRSPRGTWTTIRANKSSGTYTHTARRALDEVSDTRRRRNVGMGAPSRLIPPQRDGVHV